MAEVTIHNSMWDKEKLMRHVLEMYKYHLKQHGMQWAKKYAANAGLSGNYSRYLAKCDPWRDHDSCDIFCNYYNEATGCSLLFEDLVLGEINNED